MLVVVVVMLLLLAQQQAHKVKVHSNVISNNKADGISVTESNSNTGGLLSIGNTIRGNDIHANTRLGINLGNDVVTPNDIKSPNDNTQNDLDNGPNELMNYPTSGSVYYNPKNDQTIVSGVVNTPNPELTTIDVYANSQIHSSGFGEGRRYLGQIVPDSSGHFIAAISDGNFFSSSNSNNIGDLYPVITATTTSQKGSTSEVLQLSFHM